MTKEKNFWNAFQELCEQYNLMLMPDCVAALEIYEYNQSTFESFKKESLQISQIREIYNGF